ncbi:uncharacterized protein BP5553_05849 [Venustampulla echinocandica]|uniref:Deacetylase sirtuin-type domain-containing protein n=1 Tax=Venustampulla echinocandica TaxID=2656787 RepID=A0A370TLW2_9HELO|nr:uncharacterized protein BP5553_05849 [Venustampulla echinocandica]RDL36497.1 hypothetical protein BP5553_05849 [Venustampulla echinocandica]
MSSSYSQSFGNVAADRQRTTGASTSIEEFHSVLKSSRRILALCGAGLSAASGLGTFRGAGGMWHNYQATALATPEAFEHDPGLVWLFYAYRRSKALQAKPNAGHFALAKCAEVMNGNADKGEFLCLTQNVDGLHQRANHPDSQLKLLHSSIFDLKCHSCDYIDKNNFSDPVHPSLVIEGDGPPPQLSKKASNTVSAQAAYLDPNTELTIPLDQLPHCPNCKDGLLRPGVVWFGEALPYNTISETYDWIDAEKKIDLCLVIGTTATVYPAAGYVDTAREKGARIVVINMDVNELGAAGSLRKGDFLFEGDSARILPEILRPVVGDLGSLGLEAEAGVKSKKVEDTKNVAGEEEDEVIKYFEASP